jgi:hypothetical protein|nr:MAG TPA: tail fiber protein [Caudoviricetes sp.]
MTVSSTVNKISYVGNGVVNEFAIPFKFFENTEIQVYFKNNKTAQKFLKEGEDYSLSGAGNESGGTAVLTVTPQVGDKLVFLRVVPMTQEVDYRENEIFPAETQERALDKLTMIVQQLNEKTSRAVVVPVTGEGSPEEIVAEVFAAQADVLDKAEAAAASALAAQTAESAAEAARAAAETAVNGFDAHVAGKTAEFDGNVTEKTAAFNQNAADKQALVDASATSAGASSAAAAQSVVDAQAIVDSFTATGETIISPTVRYFRIVTAAEYAEAPSEQKTSPAYLWFITA